MISERIRSPTYYIIVSEKLEGNVSDTYISKGYDMGSDHFLVISRISMFTKWKKRKKLTQDKMNDEVYKIYLLNADSVRDLYNCIRDAFDRHTNANRESE